MRPILEAFKKLAVENPNNIFDELLDCDEGSAERLRYCLDPKTVKMVLQRKHKHYDEQAAMLEKTARFPRTVSHFVFSFFAQKTYYAEAAVPRSKCVIM